MSTVKPTVTDEMIEQGRKARDGHYLRVSPVGCTCGWKSRTYIEADGLQRFEAHLVELALEAAAPHMYAVALDAMAEHVGPDDGLLMTPAEVKHRLRWQAEQLRRAGR